MVLAHFNIDSSHGAFSISPAVVGTLYTASPLHIVLLTQTPNDGLLVGKLPVVDGTGETFNLPQFCCILIISIEIKANRVGRLTPQSACRVNSNCLFASRERWKCFVMCRCFEVPTAGKFRKLFHCSNNSRRLLFQSHCSFYQLWYEFHKHEWWQFWAIIEDIRDNPTNALFQSIFSNHNERKQYMEGIWKVSFSFSYLGDKFHFVSFSLLLM